MIIYLDPAVPRNSGRSSQCCIGFRAYALASILLLLSGSRFIAMQSRSSSSRWTVQTNIMKVGYYCSINVMHILPSRAP